MRRTKVAEPAATILRHWIATSVVVTVYASALLYTYKLEIAPYFFYMGMTYRDPDWVCYAIATVVSLVEYVSATRSKSLGFYSLVATHIMRRAEYLVAPNT